MTRSGEGEHNPWQSARSFQTLRPWRVQPEARFAKGSARPYTVRNKCSTCCHRRTTHLARIHPREQPASFERFMQFHRFGIIKVVSNGGAFSAHFAVDCEQSTEGTVKSPLRTKLSSYFYNVVNYSDACASITTYWSYKSEAHWRINGGPGHPQWLAPRRALGRSVTFNFAENGPQVRILAEVRPSAQCNGSRGTRVQTQAETSNNFLSAPATTCNFSARADRAIGGSYTVKDPLSAAIHYVPAADPIRKTYFTMRRFSVTLAAGEP